jgi:hypothetical protein
LGFERRTDDESRAVAEDGVGDATLLDVAFDAETGNGKRDRGETMTYDSEAAARFAQQTTGIDEVTIVKFIRSKDRLELGTGILPPDIDLDGATAQTIRAAQPDLFPPEYAARRYLSLELQRKFIERDAGIDGETVARLQDAEHEYMRRQGIVD